jgi:hypothetical protein
MTATGGCLCGAVRYAVEGSPSEIWLCHCQQCRKAQGGAFAASVPVLRSAFSVTLGQEHLRSYRSSPAKQRWFCSLCGSPIYSEVDAAMQLRLRAGSLDEGASLAVVGHIFVAEKAAWDRIDDALPQHPGREPGRTP